MIAPSTSISVSVKNKTKRHFFLFPFTKIKNKILGNEYELSLVFVGTQEMTKLNEGYRNKEGPTDILSFEIAKNIGEIVIAPVIANKKAKKFNETPRQYALHLFIHGCLHLKGYAHGSTMERHEQRITSEFLPSKKRPLSK